MNTDLYHYGVLGMRWGVRKKREGGDKTLTKKEKKKKIIKNITTIAVSAGTIAVGLAFADKITGGKFGQTFTSKLPPINENVKRAATAARRTFTASIWTANAGPMDFVKDFIYKYQMGPTWDQMGARF